jgi:hypothetical protein
MCTSAKDSADMTSSTARGSGSASSSLEMTELPGHAATRSISHCHAPAVPGSAQPS